MACGPAYVAVMAQLPLSFVSPLEEASSGALDGLRRMAVVKVNLWKMDGNTRLSTPSATLHDYLFNMIKHLHDVFSSDAALRLRYRSNKGGLLKDIETLTNIRGHLVQSQLNGMVKELDTVLTSLILELSP